MRRRAHETHLGHPAVHRIFSGVGSAGGSAPVSKFGNRKVEIDGITFDSQHEASRWRELKWVEAAGEISHLERQVPYELIPTIRDEKTGKVIQRSVSYVADFVYQTANGEWIVEDAKGYRTEAYKIKKKLMLWRHGIRIVEV